jgi:hypothetical protein
MTATPMLLLTFSTFMPRWHRTESIILPPANIRARAHCRAQAGPTPQPTWQANGHSASYALVCGTTLAKPHVPFTATHIAVATLQACAVAFTGFTPTVPFPHWQTPNERTSNGRRFSWCIFLTPHCGTSTLRPSPHPDEFIEMSSTSSSMCGQSQMPTMLRLKSNQPLCGSPIPIWRPA